MFSTENNLINTDNILGNNPNINLSSTDNSYGLNVNHNSYPYSGLGTSLTTSTPDLIVQNVSTSSSTTVGSTIQLNQDLRNCHKQWRGYTAPRAKQLHDKHGNSRTFELLN